MPSGIAIPLPLIPRAFTRSRRANQVSVPSPSFGLHAAGVGGSAPVAAATATPGSSISPPRAPPRRSFVPVALPTVGVGSRCPTADSGGEFLRACAGLSRALSASEAVGVGRLGDDENPRAVVGCANVRCS